MYINHLTRAHTDVKTDFINLMRLTTISRHIIMFETTIYI